MKSSHSTNAIGAFEAKNTLGTLLDRVESGEEIVITRHGRAVARLVPNLPRIAPDEVQAAFDRIRERARRLHRAKREFFDWPSWKKLREEGRP
jgi:prevent-host-death family protein